MFLGRIFRFQLPGRFSRFKLGTRFLLEVPFFCKLGNRVLPRDWEVIFGTAGHLTFSRVLHILENEYLACVRFQ